MKSNKSNNNKNVGSGGKPKTGGNSNPVITDNRFNHAQNDPKFKMYRRKDNAIKLDSRFENLMKSNSSFTSDAPIDQYGRKIEKNVVDKSIKKTYVLEEEKEEKVDKKVESKKVESKKVEKKKVEIKKVDTKKPTKKPVLAPPSSEEESEEESELEESDIETSTTTGGSEKIIEYGGFEYNSDTESSDAEEFQGDEIDSQDEGEEEEEVPRGDATKRFAVLNCDWENITSKELFVLLNSFVPSGGHIERVTVYPSDFGLEQMEKEKSLGPNKEIWNDSAKKSTIASELLNPRETSLSFDKLEDAESLDGKGFNLEKLRQYEMSKLKYYYAVVECNSLETANKIYDECEGMEIEDTANVLDLRFVPDDQKFTNKPRDTCNELPVSAPGFAFQTSILKGTTVDFTWDVDKTRKKLLTRNFSKSDAREEDLRAYLADPTSSEDDSESDESGGDDGDKNAKRLKLRNKYKSLLLDTLGDQEEKDDIQITFNSAFSSDSKMGNNQQNSDDESDDGLTVKFSDQEIDSSDEEQDSEQEDSKPRIEDESDSADDESSDSDNSDSGDDDDDQDGDDDNLISDHSDSGEPDWAKDLKSDGEEDDTVREMVINTNLNSVGKQLLKDKAKRENSNVWSDYLQEKKEKKQQKKRDKRIGIDQIIKEKEEKEKQSKKNKKTGKLSEQELKEKAELELLLMDDDITKPKGFTKRQLERDHKMNTIDPIERKKLEKKLKKKNQKLNVQDDKNLLDLQGFKMNTADERFGKIYSGSDFALDPTDPKFKRTTGMVEILSEKKNRRQIEKENQEKEILERRNKLTNNNNNTDNTTAATTSQSKSTLSEMAQNIKRKAEEQKNQLNSKKFRK